MMKGVEIQLGERIAKVELVEMNGNHLKVSVDGKIYEPDIIQVERGVYSLIVDGKSYNVELTETNGAKKYNANVLYHNYELEVVDAQSKYLRGRTSMDTEEDSVISSPMPGKVVSIPVKVGDSVKAGDTVIVVSAMKMESEYKVRNDRTVKEIRVKEGDTVGANQPLIIIE